MSEGTGIVINETPLGSHAHMTNQNFEKIGGLREEIRNSSAETNNAIAALIGKLRHERRSRSLTSSSSRGRSPGARRQPTGQYKAYEATEERIDKEEPETIREPTRLMDTRIEESPREEQNRVEEFICQLQASGELSALVGLQRVELMRSRQGFNQAYERQIRETSPDYEARMNHNARARIVAELRSGVQPATLFERFQPSR
jgi:hypothetical protein